MVSTQDFDSCNVGSSPVALVWMLSVTGSTIVSKTISSGSNPSASAIAEQCKGITSDSDSEDIGSIPVSAVYIKSLCRTMVVQLTVNEKVGGSIPIIPTYDQGEK